MLRVSLAASVGLVLGTAVLIAVALAVLLWWVLGRPAFATGVPLSARDGFDLAKIVLAVLGGVGGIVALVVAYRRQRLGEAAERREDDKLYLEHFARATDQLGADRAPVRVAGLYVLERLAQDNPDRRQTVVNVLCAYLRMPFDPPGPDDDPAARQEEQVRQTAQRLLFLHVQPVVESHGRLTGRFWPDVDLDLTGATLVAFRFTGCRIRTGRFDGARFVGPASFDRTRFERNAWFRDARFDGPAEFGGTEFGGLAEFRAARFADAVSFRDARFSSDAGFGTVRFAVPATFRGARFDGAETFTDVEGTVERG